MSELRLDKVSFSLLITSIALVLLGHGLYIQFNGTNQALVEHFASILRVFSPPADSSQAFSPSSAIYLSEERSIFILYLSAVLLSTISLLRLVLKQKKSKNVMGFAGLTSLSLALIIGTVYLTVTSGILAQI